MPQYIQSFLVLFIALSAASCSCAIYGGETFQSSNPSQRIESKIINEFTKTAKYRKTSATEFNRGNVYLKYNDDYGDFRVQGSFCSFPWELASSSPSKVEDEIANAQSEAKRWFHSQGITLKIVPSEGVIQRNQEANKTLHTNP